MKNVLHIALTVFLSVVVFYTGIGATVVKYCCPNCGTSYSILAESHQCAQSGQDSHEKSCCEEQKTNHCEDNHPAKEQQYCSTSRISVDLDSPLQKPQVKAPFVWLIAFGSLVDVSGLLYDVTSITLPLSLKEPPPILSKDYLSVIQVFII